MYVSHLTVADFRSWQRADLALEPGVNILVGQNGQGKTNLVEALGYLATLGSHRVANDAPLIRLGAEQAVVQAAVHSQGRQLILEIALLPGRANRAKVNRAAVPRPRDLLGGLRTVLFAPEDLAIVRGDPGERRRFIDELLILRNPRFAGVRADYEKILKQRATLLKSAGAARRGGSGADLRTLDVWDEQLAGVGGELLAARLLLLDDLRPFLLKAHDGLAPGTGMIDARYVSSVVASLAAAEASNSPVSSLPTAGELGEAMRRELTMHRQAEVDRGVCLVGPHRDEWELAIGGLPLRGYASHGEGWTAALALRLASYELLRSDGEEPVLMLDDVFAELDSARRDRLADIAAAAEQVVITSAVVADVPAVLHGIRFDIGDGVVRRAG